MSNKKELKFLLTVSEKVVSVNSLYQAGLKYVAGKPRPYIYKNPKAIKLENEIMDQLRALDLSDYINWLRDTKQFTITISFVIKTNITRRDVQNMDKQIIDIITKYIKEDLGVDKFDDSLFTSVHFYKSVIPKASKEYCCIQIVESTDQIRFDQEDKPKRIFLGGTCGDSGWRDELIPELDNLGLEYFNPVVPDWTPECIEKENIEKTELCNTHLYIITPEMSGVYSIAEMVNSVWECLSKGSGFVWIGILDSEDKPWEPHQRKSLEATLRLIDSIAQGNSRVRAKFIKTPKEILT